jgi:polysaccharide export outer membrane protein
MKKAAFLFFIIIGVSFGAIAAIDEYTIGPGDTLEIHAWNKDNPDILIVNPIATSSNANSQTIVTTVAQDTHSVTVSRDGRIYVPLVGVIKVEGLTMGNLEDIVKKGLKNYAPDAFVTVLVKNPKPVRVYVMGQVYKPGMYGIPDGIPGECRLINYVNLAGGFTPFSDLNHITIKRKAETFVVNFYKMEKDGDIGQNIILKDGDTVIIQQKYNQVYVLGYVNNPGPVRYIDGAAVSDYIGSAGGFTRFAATDNIGIIRGNAESPIILKVKVNKYLAWESTADNPIIMPGDVIYVPQSWFADWADTAGILIGFRDSRNAVRDLVSAPQWDPSVNR